VVTGRERRRTADRLDAAKAALRAQREGVRYRKKKRTRYAQPEPDKTGIDTEKHAVLLGFQRVGRAQCQLCIEKA
jgi:hypothetical protein